MCYNSLALAYKMKKSYHILAKKATALLLTVVFSLGIFWPALTFARVPNDPRYGQQQTMWSQINAPTAWDITTGKREVVVAIIDSGTDIDHEDLRQNIWTNEREIPSNEKDDDNNGFIDDVQGWNFVEDTNDSSPDIFDRNSDTEAVRHGTVVAGLIGAIGNNGTSSVGTNWEVRIMPIRAMDNFGSGSFVDIARAVEYATDNGADIITMSFVGDMADPGLRRSLRRAYEHGVVLVAAIGNKGLFEAGDLSVSPVYPACFDQEDAENWIIGVSSVDDQDRLADFASYGSCVDVVAPGIGLFSLEPFAPQFGYGSGTGGGWSGTSFSTPLVAGTAALIKSVQPNWSPFEITETILATSAPTAAQNPSYTSTMGRGRLDVGKAVASAAAAPVKQVFGAVYYFKDNQLHSFDVDEGRGRLVAKVEGATIVSSDHRVSSRGKVEQIVLLIKRDAFYYARLLTEDGKLVKEIPVSVEKGVSLRKVRIAAVPGQPVYFVVERFNASKKTADLAQVTESGKIKVRVGKQAALAGWDVDEKSGKLVWTELKKRKLTIHQVDLVTSAELVFPFNAVDSITAVQAASFFGKNSNEVAVLYKQNGNTKKLVVDMPSQSFQIGEVGKSGAKDAPWKMLLSSEAGEKGHELVFYKPQGGTFWITNSRGEYLREVAIPAIAGQWE